MVIKKKAGYQPAFLCRAMSRIFLLCFNSCRPLPARPYDMDTTYGQRYCPSFSASCEGISAASIPRGRWRRGNHLDVLLLTAPLRAPLISEQAATPRLYASIAATYTTLESSTYCYQYQKIEYLCDLYGRKKSTIRKALSTFGSST